MIVLIALFTIVTVKGVWVACATWSIGSHQREKNDLFKRRNHLLGKIVTDPKRHYLLANAALVGEAIVLAIRTATEWRPDTVGEYRAYATNAIGTVYGEERTFSTSP